MYLPHTNTLTDKDTLVVTEVDDLDDLPKINLAAGKIEIIPLFLYLLFFDSLSILAHASFRSNVSLRPHQVEGVNNMLYMEKAYRGGILADEVNFIIQKNSGKDINMFLYH